MLVKFYFSKSSPVLSEVVLALRIQIQRTYLVIFIKVWEKKDIAMIHETVITDIDLDLLRAMRNDNKILFYIRIFYVKLYN